VKHLKTLPRSTSLRLVTLCAVSFFFGAEAFAEDWTQDIPGGLNPIQPNTVITTQDTITPNGNFTLGKVRANPVFFNGNIPFNIKADFILQWDGSIKDAADAPVPPFPANLGGIIFNPANPNSILLLNATNTFTGPVSVTAPGILQVGADGALGTGAVDFAANTTLAASANSALPNAMTFAGNTTVNNGGHAITLTGDLATGGAVTLSLDGDGTTAFNHDNHANLAGPIAVNAGKVSVGDDGALGIGRVTFAGGTTLAASADSSLPNAMTFAGATTLNNNGHALTLGGVLGGVGGLTFDGGGVTTLTKANLYGGNTTIAGAGTTVTLGAAPAAMSAGKNVNITAANGILRMAAAGPQVIGDLTGDVTANVIVGGAINALTLGTAADITYDGAISGLGGVTKTGAGNLNLTNNHTFTGPLAVNQGTITLTRPNADVLSGNGGVTVAQGATLAGLGNITGNVINNGTVAPTSMAADLSGIMVTGNFTQPAGGTFNAVLAGENGICSKLSVIGQANIGDSKLNIIAPDQAYAQGNTYIIIDSNTPINGVFGNSTVLPRIGGLKPVILYNNGGNILGNDLTIRLDPVTIDKDLQGATPNQIIVAEYINGLPVAAPGSDLALVQGALDNLGQNSPAQLGQALDDISSAQTGMVKEDIVNSLTSVRLANLRNYSGAEGHQAASFATGHGQRSLGVVNQLQGRNIDKPQETYHTTRAGIAANFDHQMQQSIALSRRKGGVWAHGFGNIGKQKNHKYDRGYKSEMGGFLAGMDYRVNRNVFIGAGLGSSSTTIGWKDRGGKGRIRGYFATGYGTWYKDGFYIDGALVGGINRYKARRHIGIGSTIDRNATNHHKGYELISHLGAGYEIDFKQVIVEPFAGVDYSYIHQDGYTETGAGSMNSKVKEQSMALLRTEAGFNVFKTLNFEGGNWTPKAKLSYILKDPIKKDKTKVALEGQTTFFAVESFTRTRNQVSPGFGVTVRFNSGAFVDARYNAELDSSFRTHEIGLKVGYAF
jgi:outer membrane autotransporter protein